MGEIILITGCMFSGKTSELIKRCNTFKKEGKNVLFVKFISDTRYAEDTLVSHDQVRVPAVSVLSLDILSVDDIDVIGIDEGQFFPEIAKYSDIWANQNKVVLVSALTSDFKRNAFVSILHLIPKVDTIITSRHAKCDNCGKRASFSAKKGNQDSGQIAIGGKDLYMPVCRRCFRLNAHRSARRIAAGGDK